MTLTDLSITGIADAYTDHGGDTFFLTITGGTGTITSTRGMHQPEAEGTADDVATWFASWRAIANGTDLGPIPEDHITLKAYRAAGGDVTSHPAAEALRDLLGELPWMGRGRCLSFHRRCSAEYLLRKGAGCVPLLNETRTDAEKDADADRQARRHLWEAELLASDDLIAWATTGFGSEAIAALSADMDPNPWPCTAREFLDSGGLAVDAPNGAMLDQLIADRLIQGDAVTLTEAVSSVSLWSGISDRRNEDDTLTPPGDQDRAVERCLTASRWLVELLCNPELTERWLATAPQAEVEQQHAWVASYKEAQVRPFEIRPRAAEDGLRCSVTGEPITDTSVTLYDRMEESTAVVLSPTAVLSILRASLAPAIKSDPAEVPEALPLTAEQVGAVEFATVMVTAVQGMLRSVVEDPAVHGALMAWHKATSSDNPETRWPEIAENQERWRDLLGLGGLSDAAWPILEEFIPVLALDQAPPAAES